MPELPVQRVVPDWVRDLTEETLGPAPFAIGETVAHPDGRRVLIVSGTY